MPRLMPKPLLSSLGAYALTLGALFLCAGHAGAQTVFINEVHYNNKGRDAGEAVEVAGPAMTDLNGWQLVFYNGKNGRPYRTVDLEGSLPDLQNGYGTLTFGAKGIENGAPDGIALVNPEKEVVQFISYEGSFAAAAGPAEGLTAMDIGVRESDSTMVGHSLQLKGNGKTLADFTWEKPVEATPGAVNAGQTFQRSEPKKAGTVATHVP